MSGGSETTTTSVPEWVRPYAENYMGRAQQVADLPYQAYTGQTTAQLTPYQTAALDATAARAMRGSPVTDAASTELQRTMSGGYLGATAPANTNIGAQNANADAFNPYAGVANANASALNPYAATRNADANAANAYAGVRNDAAGVRNAYAGPNSHLQAMIDASTGDVVRNYNMAVRPQQDAIQARSGSFGNSGLAAMENESRRNLAGELGRISSGLRFQDYTTQQGLAENAANRQFQAGESRAGRLYGAGAQQAGQRFQAGESLASRLFGAGAQQAGQRFQAGESQAGRLYGAGQQQAGQRFQAGESLASRLFQGGESQAGRQQAGYENERARMLSGAGMAPAIAGQDYIDAAQLYGAGAAYRGQEQANLTDDYRRFIEARDYPRQQLDTMGRGLGMNFGSSTTGPGANPLAQGAGSALAAYSLYNMGNSGASSGGGGK